MIFWAALVLKRWGSLDGSILGLPVRIVALDDPNIGFLPVFATKEAAIEWAGDEKLVVPIAEREKAE